MAASSTEWMKTLEDDFCAKNCSLRTFSEWKEKRKHQDNWKNLIRTKGPDLISFISCDELFFNKLLSLNVFNKRAIENFKHKKGNCSQVSDVLDALSRRPFEDFLSFCQTLVETQQKHVVINYLTPEIPRHLCETDAVPANVPLPVVSTPKTPPQFDWRKRIRENLVELSSAIDPDSGLITELLSRGVINQWTVDTFKTTTGKTHRAGKILEYIQMKRPDEDFCKLCDALEKTNQRHVVDKWLMPESCDRTDLNASVDPRSTPHVQIDEAELSAWMVPGWRDLIVKQRNEIVDKLETTDEFLNELVRYGVMNHTVCEVAKEITGQCSRNEYLLDHMRRRSDQDFARFRVALKKCNQDYVISDYLSTNTAGSSKKNVLDSASFSADAKDADMKDVKPENASKTSSSWSEVSPVFETQAEEHDRSVLAPSGKLHVQVRQPLVHQENGSISKGLEFGAEAQECQNAMMYKDAGPYGTEQMETEISEEDCGPTSIDHIVLKKSDRTFFEQVKATAYVMSKKVRGRCYIFNNENVHGMQPRKGTSVDGKNLTRLFTELNFKVIEFHNLTAEAMRSKIVELSHDASLAHDQCLILFILSHGTVKNVENKMKDCIFGSDGKWLTPEKLLVPLTDRVCPHLKGKPRLVFFQACRGEFYDYTDCQSVQGDNMDVDPSKTATDFTPDEAPSYTDFLIGYPTQSSYRSFRNTEYGSWYINAFVRVFMKHAHEMGLCSMLNMLNGYVSRWASNTGQQDSHNKTQIANYVSNLRKADLFFFPGIVIDE